MAKAELDKVYLEDLCFNAQQAVEKAIKGVLIKYEVEFPYIHDIAKLLKLVEYVGLSVPEIVWDADGLTPFAVVARYPDMAPPITLEKYHELVKVAEKVVVWAEEIILQGMDI